MIGEIVYLDSSAIVKRYIREPGSDVVRMVYVKAYSGELAVSYSLWNIGEVLGVLDKARAIGGIDGETYSTVRRRFLMEARRMAKLGALLVVPLKVKIIRECWALIEKHHIYEADALQVASARHVGAKQFLTGDGRLHEVALEEGLNSRFLH